jgi:hypothetical protein
MPTAARLAICFCLGALLGTLLDGIHVYGDVESYSDPSVGRWAWFVPLEFGLVGAFAGALIPALERLAGPPWPPHWPLGVRIAELCLIVAAYLSTVVLDEAPVLITTGLIALLAIRLTFRPVPGDWLYALIGAAVGPVVEATISALGAFDYSDPDVAGIPMWLPALWALGGIFIRRLFLPIVYRSRSSTRPPSAPT